MWWKKKRENEFLALLALDDLPFAKAVSRFYSGMDAATKAHSLVAYMNLLSTLSAFSAVAKRQGQEGTTVEDFLRLAVEQLQKNQNNVVSSRR
ncbi:hypothetical protein GOL69_17995 [Sinorhizobium medicae]|nr:hypothetical protein [Sinorhizobium medicae]